MPGPAEGDTRELEVDDGLPRTAAVVARAWPSVLKFTRGVPPTGLAQRNSTMKSARTRNHGKQHEVEVDDGVPRAAAVVARALPSELMLLSPQ